MRDMLFLAFLAGFHGNMDISSPSFLLSTTYLSPVSNQQYPSLICPHITTAALISQQLLSPTWPAPASRACMLQPLCLSPLHPSPPASLISLFSLPWRWAAGGRVMQGDDGRQTGRSTGRRPSGGLPLCPTPFSLSPEPLSLGRMGEGVSCCTARTFAFHFTPFCLCLCHIDGCAFACMQCTHTHCTHTLHARTRTFTASLHPASSLPSPHPLPPTGLSWDSWHGALCWLFSLYMSYFHYHDPTSLFTPALPPCPM